MFNHAVRHPIQVKARNFSLSRPGWDGTFSFIFLPGSYPYGINS